MTPDFRLKFLKILRAYLQINIAAFAILPLLRLLQYYLINAQLDVQADLFFLEFKGLIKDMTVWVLVSAVSFLLFYPVSLLNRNAGKILLSFIFITLVTAEQLLFYYFIFSTNLLDHVVFSYTFREMAMIASSSGKVSFTTLGTVVLFALLGTAFLIFMMTRKMTHLLRSGLIFSGIVLTVIILRIFMVSPFTGSYSDGVSENKTSHFIMSCLSYLSRPHEKAGEDEVGIKEATERYQALHPDKVFTGPTFPFLHLDNQQDVLGPLFNLGEKKPNIVVIITESLSTCFMGKDAFCGSYTPFLDSLAGHSLYWPNFLSTCEKTFNALPSIFGSLPPGNPNSNTFESGNFPQHLSSIKILKENGYHTSFFYGGESEFDNMKTFLYNQNIDFILDYFGPEYKKPDKNFYWGYQDHDLFSRSLEVINSEQKPARLDIYLTLSTHSPFHPPDIEYYRELTEKKMKENGAVKMPGKFIESHLDIFSSVMYFDQSLRDFFRDWSKRSDFNNTIFIITGDHGMTELNMRQYSEIEKYHVPLIIYSPMLKYPRRMEAVSTHLDITPSLLEMLKRKYQINERNYIAWLGDGIDTSVMFRNVKRMAFIGSNRDMMECIDGEYYLCREFLYKIKPGLKLLKINNKDAVKKFHQELEDFKLLNRFVTNRNMLIPSYVFAGKMVDEVDIPIKDTCYFTLQDSIRDFRDLMNNVKVESKYNSFRFSFSIELLCLTNDPFKTPKIVFDICDKKGKSLLWNSIEIPQTQNADERKWVNFSTLRNFDLTPLKTKTDSFYLKCYIWNNKKVISYFRNPDLRLTGFIYK